MSTVKVCSRRETVLLQPQPPTDGDPYMCPGVANVSVDREGRVLISP